MPIYKTLSAPFCALLLGSMVAGEAKAQAPAATPQPLDVYAAKFTCGKLSVAGAGGGDADVVVGVYATSINIHNPQQETKVTYNKTIVVANREIIPQPSTGQPAAQIVKFTNLGLPANQAEFVDCQFIYRQLSNSTPPIPPGSHIEGFVVISVLPTTSGVFPALDVVGKYTARPSNSEVSSLDIVVYNSKRITQ